MSCKSKLRTCAPCWRGSPQLMAATLRVRMAERRERQAQVLPHECRPGVCQLSSASSDGFGHQFDAKLSCIAVAQRIGMKYVHVPFRGNAHGESSLAPLEALVGLNQSFWTGRTSAGLRWNWRQRAAPAWWPAPYGRRGACSGKPYLFSWLLLMDLARHNASAHRPALCCTNVLCTPPPAQPQCACYATDTSACPWPLPRPHPLPTFSLDLSLWLLRRAECRWLRPQTPTTTAGTTSTVTRTGQGFGTTLSLECNKLTSPRPSLIPNGCMASSSSNRTYSSECERREVL